MQGIISKKQIEKLSSLVFSPEEQYVVDVLEANADKVHTYLRLLFLLRSLRTCCTFLLIVFAQSIFQLQNSYILTIFVMYMLLNIFLLYVSVLKAGYFVNFYKRIIGSFLDNLLCLVIDRFRISLVRVVDTFPNPKDIAKSLEESSLSALNLVNGLSDVSGLIIALFIIFATYVATGNSNYLLASILTLILFSILGMLIYYGNSFSPYEQKFYGIDDKFDLEFRNTQALLTKSGINLYPKEYEHILNAVVALTTRINFISYSMLFLVPAIALFLPYFLGAGSNLIFLVQVLYLTPTIFQQKALVNQYNAIKTANHCLSQFEGLLDTIVEEGSELTPDLYEEYKKQYVKVRGGVSLIDSIDPGDLIIKKLAFKVGRDENTNAIVVDDLTLAHSKVHTLVGDLGIGKSVFGRLLTLRYSDFTADFIGLNYKDIRTFTSLDIGLNNLIFSGLRNISTSYRSALSSYLNPNSIENLFVKRLSINAIDLSKVRKHFDINAQYYSEMLPKVNSVLDKYAANPNQDLNVLHLNKNQRIALRDCFRSKFTISPTDDSVFIIALIVEYTAFAHMKLYIPEATIYFMDAILSEPPISDGQRRRILFALDILLVARLFVVDEPFVNIDLTTSKNIMLTLAHYAVKNKAVVLILDQKIHYELINACRPEEVGSLLEFDTTGGALSITEKSEV